MWNASGKRELFHSYTPVVPDFSHVAGINPQTYGRRVMIDGTSDDRQARIRAKQMAASVARMKARGQKQVDRTTCKHFVYPPRPAVRI